jgi:beta-phosphoglucomutase family hydrolase
MTQSKIQNLKSKIQNQKTFSLDPEIQGLIFDSDGTLVDTMPLHYMAWQDTLLTKGAQFPETLFYELAGVPSDKIVEILNREFTYSFDPKAVALEKEGIFLERYLPQARPIEPVVAIAQQYKNLLPMAVATGGILAVVSSALKAIGLTDFFDAVVTAEDVKHGKPAPDTFLVAAERLKVEPHACLVFEDSDLGLEAARRAGMVAVDIRPWLKSH